ncbi:MAG: hypothetical protein CMJ83_04360 [Planctomycetes bacterium]|nr:hypothetical protein [Planctomycetota bacterium]
MPDAEMMTHVPRILLISFESRTVFARYTWFGRRGFRSSLSLLSVSSSKHSGCRRTRSVASVASGLSMKMRVVGMRRSTMSSLMK